MVMAMFDDGANVRWCSVSAPGHEAHQSESTVSSRMR